MTNLSKKWGTVIGCWCVALVLVVTGICLALTIPSSAAEVPESEAAWMVITPQKTYYVDTMYDAFLTAKNAKSDVRIKLIKDYVGTSDDSYLIAAEDTDIQFVLDLNGHLLTMYSGGRTQLTGNLVMIDSQPEVEHVLPNAEVVRGGTVYATGREFCVGVSNWGGGVKQHQLTINGGNFCGNGYFNLLCIDSSVGSLVINAGNITWSSSVDSRDCSIYCSRTVDETNRSTIMVNGGRLLKGQMICVYSPSTTTDRSYYYNDLGNEEFTQWFNFNNVSEQVDLVSGKTYYIGDDIAFVHNHTYTNWFTDIQPTYKEYGHRYHTCVLCNKREDEQIAKLTENELGNTVSDDGKIVVTFDAETKEYSNMAYALGEASEMSTTAENPVRITLQSDVETDKIVWANYSNCVFDLNGYIWRSNELEINNFNTLRFVDSNSDLLRYCHYVSEEQGYEFAFTSNLIGHGSTMVSGGIITALSGQINVYSTMVNDTIYTGQMVIDGGNFLGKGEISLMNEFAGAFNVTAEVDTTPRLVLNQGVLQLITHINDADMGIVSDIALSNMFGEIEINGGRIYGEIVAYDDLYLKVTQLMYAGLENGALTEDDMEDPEKLIDYLVEQGLDRAKLTAMFEENYNPAFIVDLTNPQTDAVKIHQDIEIKPQYNEDGSLYYYEAVNKNGTAQQPADNNNGAMIAIIVLGAATVVMLAGVGAAIGIVAKRRKRQAA